MPNPGFYAEFQISIGSVWLQYCFLKDSDYYSDSVAAVLFLCKDLDYYWDSVATVLFVCGYSDYYWDSV